MRDAEDAARAIQQEMVGHEHTSMAGGSGCYPCGVITDDFAGHEVESIAAIIRERDAEARAATLAGTQWESCGTNRLGQPTRRLVGPVEVEP